MNHILDVFYRTNKEDFFINVPFKKQNPIPIEKLIPNQEPIPVTNDNKYFSLFNLLRK